MSSDAYSELTVAVETAKSGALLSVVTVVVPGAAAGRDVMKHLARSGGLANTRVFTLSQAVAFLAAPVLAPRVSLDYPLLEASVQKVLSDEPGVFADVADQPITSQAIAGASLALAGHANPTASNPTRLVNDMLRVHRLATSTHASTYYLPHEAYAVAKERLDELGTIVVFRPCETDPAALEVLRAMQARGETIDSNAQVTGTMVVHTSDADDEVRAVSRIVRKYLSAGIPGHRIGVFYGAEDPYLHLIHEHFTSGDIEFAGPDCRSLIDRPIARSLLALLQLDIDLMPRRELLAILAERAVLRPDVDDNPISYRRLELLTRRHIPIVGGADWERLTQIDPAEPKYRSAPSLYAFVQSLRSDLRSITSAATWAEAAGALRNLVDSRFVTTSSLDTDFTQGDAEAITRICYDLYAMDGIAPPPTAAGLVDALTVRINGERRTVGRSGAGVSIGPISAGVGRDLDVCIVVGVAEGIVPARRREDPLIPAELTGRSLADEIAGQQRQLVLTLGSGRHDRIVSFPRGSLRGGAEKVPSRWLLPTMEKLSGTPINVVDWQRQTKNVDSIVTVESFDVATQKFDPRIGTGAASPTEWRLRALAGVPARERRLTLDDPTVLQGMEMRSDRLNGRFSRFNGNLSTVKDLVKVFSEPISPTSLEQWVESPYRFFVRSLLGVDALDDPDEVAQLDPLTRGNLIHATLEQYIQAVIDGKDATLDRLLGIADEVLDEAILGAPGWLPQLWQKDRAIIRRDIETWFDHDSTDRADGWTPVGVEQRFGREGTATVLIDLGSGTVRFTGSIDRIDGHHDGRFRVTDYKTGQMAYSRGISEAAPTQGGKKFQLPVYGLFAATLGEQVSARYWFATSKGGFGLIEYPITDAVLDILRTDLTLVHEAVTAGYFPPRTADTFWADALVDLIGKAGLERAWVNLGQAPEIADYIAKHGV
ncbi:RecB family exonuclease [Williamsia muralis]|uniref:RecB family exonuclease n=1 Tax=Williamsia marianensis TaxID=85044 RepID=A0A495K5Z6_WILMA|nr:PD-(D/E)XK nuclease family protein [Williamsia muralis]RKR96611.1 RecB family exonuclease [Williamsia muralis]